jgi:hypothetical protein
MLSLMDDDRVQVFCFKIYASNKYVTLDHWYAALSALEELQGGAEPCQFPAHSS